MLFSCSRLDIRRCRSHDARSSLRQTRRSNPLSTCLFASLFAASSWGQSPEEPAGLPSSLGSLSREEGILATDSLEDLQQIDALLFPEVRSDVRRTARSAQRAELRAKAIQILSLKDPAIATARICARALRTDPAAEVRRAGAECLGRLPRHTTEDEQSSLVAALSDENMDVITMVGWALVRTGNTTALSAMEALKSHSDPRVAQLFQTYVERLQEQQRQRAQTLQREPERIPKVPLAAGPPPFELALSSAWLALYGGFLGYAHGALVPLAHLNAADFSILSALAVGIGGFAIGGSLGATQQLSFQRAHAIVQVGTFATLAGYASGLLSEAGPARGLNATNYGLFGTLAGNGLALALVHLVEPTTGALVFGALSSAGTGLGATLLASGYGFAAEDAIAAGLWTGAITGLLTTVVAAPFDWGTLPIFSATALGCLGAITGGLFESSPTQQAWSMVAGYGLGAATGALFGFALPPELDPFHKQIRLQAPTISLLPPVQTGRAPQPLVVVAGTFSPPGF